MTPREPWHESSNPDRVGRAVAARVVLLVLATLILVVSIWAVTVAWAPWKGQGDVRKDTQGNAAYRIAAYDHFYDLCASAQTMQGNATATQSLLAQATDPAEQQRLQTTLAAQQNQLRELVNQYNADARKAGTVGQFKASDLPYSLDITQEISCTA